MEKFPARSLSEAMDAGKERVASAHPSGPLGGRQGIWIGRTDSKNPGYCFRLPWCFVCAPCVRDSSTRKAPAGRGKKPPREGGI